MNELQQTMMPSMPMQAPIINPVQPIMNPYFSRPVINQPATPTPINNGIIWVNGLEGAKAYQMQPNSNMILLDSDVDGKMYIKICDNIGMCTLRTFDYTETTEQSSPPPAIDLSNYVTRDELNNLLRSFKENNNGKQSVSTVKPKPNHQQ